jgi:hypothetical protein
VNKEENLSWRDIVEGVYQYSKGKTDRPIEINVFLYGAATLLVQPKLSDCRAKVHTFKLSNVIRFKRKSVLTNSVTEIFNHAVVGFKIQNDTPYIAIDNTYVSQQRGKPV